MEPSIKKRIKKYSAGAFSQIEDDIAIEKRLRIFIRDKEIISFFCSPSMIKELVVGFAMSEGLFEGKGRFCPEDIVIEDGSFNNNEIKAHLLLEAKLDIPSVTITSGCAKGVSFFPAVGIRPIEDGISIRPEPIFDLFRKFQQRSTLYKLTGGVHSAALSDGKEIIAFAEDIGRHNAVDKIIGYSFLKGIPTKGKILLSSGRLSSEIAYKTARASIPILVSRTAPTTLAIEIAEKNNLTIIGFLRGSRFTIYSHPQRVIAP